MEQEGSQETSSLWFSTALSTTERLSKETMHCGSETKTHRENVILSRKKNKRVTIIKKPANNKC